MSIQRLLTLLLIIFIIGGASYFAFLQFKKEVTIFSPSPSPVSLNFLFEKPQPTTQPVQTQSPPQPSQLPFAKNKLVGTFPGILKDEFLKNKKVVVATSKGTFELEIFPDVPMAASNFIILAANGFYDGLIFHRVEDWVIQGGDPLGNGTGGPGYIFPDEAVIRDYNKGVVAMANAGPNTNGSQFFILLEDRPDLPKNYTIFAKVLSGMEVVEKIEAGDVMKKVSIQD